MGHLPAALHVATAAVHKDMKIVQRGKDRMLRVNQLKGGIL
jgi:hypothetical protein